MLYGRFFHGRIKFRDLISFFYRTPESTPERNQPKRQKQNANSSGNTPPQRAEKTDPNEALVSRLHKRLRRIKKLVKQSVQQIDSLVGFGKI